MIRELLKPLEWDCIEFDSSPNAWITESALHDYQITYDDKEKSYTIFYYERLTEESGNKPGKSVDELKQWAEEVHYPSKMAKWIGPANKWVSVEDKLPDECGHYLTFNGYHYAIQTWNENGWLRLYDAKSITHWQKLPEPPKEVDNVQ